MIGFIRVKDTIFSINSIKRIHFNDKELTITIDFESDSYTLYFKSGCLPLDDKDKYNKDKYNKSKEHILHKLGEK